MANKQVNALTVKTDMVGDDLIPVYDSEEAGAEKLKQGSITDVIVVPKWSSLTGVGVSPGLVVALQVAVPMVSIGAPESNPYAPLSAADFILSVIPNGDPPYLYGLNKTGDAPDVTHADPRDAVVNLDCTDVGTIIFEVWISDNTGNMTYVECYALVQDPLGVCVP